MPSTLLAGLFCGGFRPRRLISGMEERAASSLRAVCLEGMTMGTGVSSQLRATVFRSIGGWLFATGGHSGRLFTVEYM